MPEKYFEDLQSCMRKWDLTQSAIACSKSTMETPEQYLIKVNNKDIRTNISRNWISFTHFPPISIVDFEHIYAGWQWTMIHFSKRLLLETTRCLPDINSKALFPGEEFFIVSYYLIEENYLSWKNFSMINHFSKFCGSKYQRGNFINLIVKLISVYIKNSVLDI